MRWPLLPLIGIALLSGCVWATSEPVCPTFFDYPPEVQAQLADEIEALPPGSATERFIADYGVVRNEIRACQ